MGYRCRGRAGVGGCGSAAVADAKPAAKLALWYGCTGGASPSRMLHICSV